MIYPSLFLSICLFSFFGCKKENSSTSPKFDDYFILEHYTGTKDTFRIRTDPTASMALTFQKRQSFTGAYSGKYVNSFNLFKGAFVDNYDLVLAKTDDAVTIGQVYRTNNTTLTSFSNLKVGYSISATTTDIQFSEYKPAERITGNFKAYANGGVLWYKGEFSFNPTH